MGCRECCRALLVVVSILRLAWKLTNDWISGQQPCPPHCPLPHNCLTLAAGELNSLNFILFTLSNIAQFLGCKLQSHEKVVEQLYLEKAGWRDAPALATLAALV